MVGALDILRAGVCSVGSTSAYASFEDLALAEKAWGILLTCVDHTTAAYVLINLVLGFVDPWLWSCSMSRLAILASYKPEDRVQPNQNHAGNLNSNHLRSTDDLRAFRATISQVR